MAEASYEEGIKTVYKGLILLAIVTIAEVAIALVGNGHVIEGFKVTKLIMYPLMIGLSLYKAYFIVYEFMHMGHEAKGLRMSVLLPLAVLIWGVIAFLQEGNSWGENRQRIRTQDKPARVMEKTTAAKDAQQDVKVIETVEEKHEEGNHSEGH